MVDGYRAVGMQQLLDAVRSTGNKNLVFASGNMWANDLRMIVDNPLNNDANVVYAAHSYPFNCEPRRQHRRALQLPAASRYPPHLDTQIAPAIAKRAVMLTEFGTQRAIPGEVQAPIDWAEHHKIGWAAWLWDDGKMSDFCLLHESRRYEPSVIGRPVYDALQRAALLAVAVASAEPDRRQQQRRLAEQQRQRQRRGARPRRAGALSVGSRSRSAWWAVHPFGDLREGGLRRREFRRRSRFDAHRAGARTRLQRIEAVERRRRREIEGALRSVAGRLHQHASDEVGVAGLGLGEITRAQREDPKLHGDVRRRGDGDHAAEHQPTAGSISRRRDSFTSGGRSGPARAAAASSYNPTPSAASSHRFHDANGPLSESKANMPSPPAAKPPSTAARQRRHRGVGDGRRRPAP